MKKVIFTTIYSIFIGLSCYAGTEPNEKPLNISERNQKIYEVTKKNLASFLENIPAGFESQHGFSSRSEFAKAVAGPVYTIVGVDENWNTFSTNLYNIPLLVNNEYRSMITVSEKDGVYEIQTVGAAAAGT